MDRWIVWLQEMAEWTCSRKCQDCSSQARRRFDYIDWKFIVVSNLFLSLVDIQKLSLNI